MRDLIILLIGVVAGGAMNFSVQFALERHRRRRSLVLAARIVYNELSEFGDLETNDGPLDASHLHAAWREHRSALIDLGADEWSAIEKAVTNAVFPTLFPKPPSSSNGPLERALWLLEPHTQIPREMRGFA